MTDKELDDLLATEAEHAEAAEADQSDRPLPPGTTVTQPNRGRSKVLQVRLNPDEYQAIERLAAARGLPVSTVARAQLLALLDDPAAEVDPLQRLMQAAREFAIGA